MFKENKYTTWYFRIIDRARERILDEYTEVHHIIPKSMGGSNNSNNLVKLSAKEHFICHLLLVKMTDGTHKKSMSYALWLMCNIRNKSQTNRYRINSTLYSIIRKNHSIVVSLDLKGKKKNYSSFGGRSHTDESIKLMKEKKKGENNPNFGVIQKSEWNKAKSDAQKGITKPILICQHCNKKIGGHGNYKRWHGSNCKYIGK